MDARRRGSAALHLPRRMRSNATTSIASVRTPHRVDVSKCFSAHSTWNKLGRALWGVVWLFLFRPTPRFLHGWRRFLLRCFGAKIGRGVFPFPSVKVWAPWNLEVGDHCALSDGVNCYCVDRIAIGSHDVRVAPGLCDDERANDPGKTEANDRRVEVGMRSGRDVRVVAATP